MGPRLAAQPLPTEPEHSPFCLVAARAAVVAPSLAHSLDTAKTVSTWSSPSASAPASCAGGSLARAVTPACPRRDASYCGGCHRPAAHGRQRGGHVSHRRLDRQDTGARRAAGTHRAGSRSLLRQEHRSGHTYVLLAAPGYGAHSGQDDALFRAAQRTRAEDLRRDEPFEPTSDVIVMRDFRDLGQLSAIFSSIAADNARQNRRTVEVGIYSPAGYDGPTGAADTSRSQWLGVKCHERDGTERLRRIRSRLHDRRRGSPERRSAVVGDRRRRGAARHMGRSSAGRDELPARPAARRPPGLHSLSTRSP
jgi:hypothetical protein